MIFRASSDLAVILYLLFSVSCSSGGASADLQADLLAEVRGFDALDLVFELHPDASDVPAESVDLDAETEADGPWIFNRSDHDLVHGWILLDADPEAMVNSIEAAAGFGVNHIQLSHDLIMEIEEILGEGEEVEKRIETLNLGISTAHDHGMKAYIWSHEFSGTGANICYEPDGEVWASRAGAYRQAFERLPDLDGVILMFGSAPLPPWFTFCTCDWCQENYEDPNPIAVPPNEERIEFIAEQLGEVIVVEQGRELFIRTFVHEPAEIPWHGDGLTAADGVDFTGMHKGPVQDWQPYNPHHPNMGHVGDHPSVVELDLAGEYFGQSILPFCAPGYYWFRMNHMWDRKGIGVVARVQRGANHALGTPNEVNMLAVKRLVEDKFASLESIWDEFIESFYGLPPDHESQETLKTVLKDTFPIRRKSHYALGIWALEKSSDFPDSAELDQFKDRGYMPKWDPDWQEVWDRLDKPERQVVLWLWQEGSEAVDLGAESLTKFEGFKDELSPEDSADLKKRLLHQWYAARAWRAMDLYIWARRAKLNGIDFEQREAWQRWAFEDLTQVRDAMIADGLAGVGVASPGRIDKFLASVEAGVPKDVDPEMPDSRLFSPVRVLEQTSTSATLQFVAGHSVLVNVDYGLEIPDFGQTAVAEAEAGEKTSVELQGLESSNRYVVRLRANWDGLEHRSGDWWVFVE